MSLLLIFISFSNLHSQEKHKNYFVQWTTWSLIQAVPSPVFFQDNDAVDTRMQFGFRWQVTPINYSFNTNKFISPISILMVNPMHRYGGSVEAIIQPEWTTASYKFSDLNRFQMGVGIRGYYPLIEDGEYLSISLAGKYRIRKDISGTSQNTYALETGIYTFFGLLGLHFNYNFNSVSRFDLGISVKYF